MSDSLFYYEYAKANLCVFNDNLASLIQLQAMVVAILFKLFIDNPRVAFDLLPLACNTAMRLGLGDRSKRDLTREDHAAITTQNLYWILLYLDSYICGLLNENPFLDISKAKSETLVVMQLAARNTAQTVRSSEILLLNVGLALSIEIFDIQQRIANLHLPDVSQRKAQNVQFEEIRQLEQELDDFKVVCDAIFPQGEIVNVVARQVLLISAEEHC